MLISDDVCESSTGLEMASSLSGDISPEDYEQEYCTITLSVEWIISAG